MLTDLLTAADVPSDLVAFTDGDRHLVSNPAMGAWLVLDGDELAALQRLANDVPAVPPPGTGTDLTDKAWTERLYAKLVMARLISLPGQAPTLERFSPPLKVVYYAITDGCNLRCPYCYASSEKCLPGELGTAESFDLVEQVAAMNAHTMVFTGGEPMLRKDLFDVAGHARSLGLQANIITNATLIRTPEIARRVADTFATVTVSIDGGTAEVHERTRGKGTFAKTVNALRMLNDAGVKPMINHVVTPDNLDDLPDLAALFGDIEVQRVRLMHHTELGRGASDGKSFGWSQYEYVHRFTWTDPRSGNLLPDGPTAQSSCTTRLNCGIGGNEIYVNSLGEVYPCKLVTGPEHKVGSVRGTPLRELFDHQLLADLRSYAVFEGQGLADCRPCYIRGSCGGGCRAYHMAATGSLDKDSRALCRVLRHQMVTSMWVGAGAGRDTLVDSGDAAFVPRLVRDGSVHPVYDDWVREAAELAANPRVVPASVVRRRLPVSVASKLTPDQSPEREPVAAGPTTRSA